MRKKVITFMCALVVTFASILSSYNEIIAAENEFDQQIEMSYEESIIEQLVLDSNQLAVEQDLGEIGDITTEENVTYPSELEEYVQKIVEQTDPTLISGDPQLDSVKTYLCELKQVYPEKSYSELHELLQSVQSEDDYNKLINKTENVESEVIIEPEFLSAENGAISTFSTSTKETSTEPVIGEILWPYTRDFECTKTKEDTTTTCTFGEAIASDNYIVPGLEHTNVAGDSCEDMVPQGMCKVGNYLLISAYCAEKEHNSVIYVLSLSRLEYICTLKTDLVSHVGGIAYDEERYLWVCDSGDSENVKQDMYAYDMSSIESYIAAALIYSHKTANIDSVTKCTVDTVPSFCTFYDGMLWVGTFNMGATDQAIGYKVDGLTLTKGAKINVPINSQGMAFHYYYGKYYCTFTTSYGRRNDSVVYTYTMYTYKNREDSTATLLRSEPKSIIMPSMVEGVLKSDYTVYIIFESAANKYRNGDGNGYSAYACDRICMFTTNYIYK